MKLVSVGFGVSIGDFVGMDVSSVRSVGSWVGSQIGALVGQGIAHVIGALVSTCPSNTGVGCKEGILATGTAVTGTSVG